MTTKATLASKLPANGLPAETVRAFRDRLETQRFAIVCLESAERTEKADIEADDVVKLRIVTIEVPVDDDGQDELAAACRAIATRRIQAAEDAARDREDDGGTPSLLEDERPALPAGAIEGDAVEVDDIVDAEVVEATDGGPVSTPPELLESPVGTRVLDRDGDPWLLREDGVFSDVDGSTLDAFPTLAALDAEFGPLSLPVGADA